LPDPAPDRNIFVRSDQYNFVKVGVPAISFKFGAPAGSEGEGIMKAWIKERYHSPSDDIHQPVDKEAAVTFTNMLKDLCVEIANAPERPRWKETSFFKRFAVDEPVAHAAGE
jgi:Zn-dependent M28 family amino/carboxypeptidase